MLLVQRSLQNKFYNKKEPERLELLTKDNYDSLCLQVEALLTKNETWGNVSGEIARPALAEGAETSKQLKSWVTEDKKRTMADLIFSISS